MATKPQNQGELSGKVAVNLKSIIKGLLSYQCSDHKYCLSKIPDPSMTQNIESQ